MRNCCPPYAKAGRFQATLINRCLAGVLLPVMLDLACACLRTTSSPLARVLTALLLALTLSWKPARDEDIPCGGVRS